MQKPGGIHGERYRHANGWRKVEIYLVTIRASRGLDTSVPLTVSSDLESRPAGPLTEVFGGCMSVSSSI